MRIRVIRFFKRLKIKFFLWTQKSKIMPTYKEDVSSYEKTCFKICLKVINHKNTDFMIAPLSDKKYLKNDELDIFITFSDRRVDITNHVYHYNVKLSDRDWSRLNFIFDNETDKRRIDMEYQVNSQIKNSLTNVLEKISNL
jgi:hypothetical protein